MKKIILLLALLSPLCLHAQNIKKGYHGFVDAGYCYYISQLDPNAIELTTSHGYQFNPYIFLGAGLGFDYSSECKWGNVGGHPFQRRFSKVDIPVFFNVHSNFTKTKFSPFIDAKFGAYVNNGGGIYANAALGCRYAIGSNMGISLSAGYEMRKLTAEQIELTTGTKYNNYKSTYYYTDITDQSVDGFFVKVGFDF